MGNEAANVETLKRAYALWHDTKGQSVDHWFTFIADDINFGSLAAGAPPLAFARSYDNSRALRGYFDGLLKDWEMIHYSAYEFVAQGDVVFLRGSTSWRNRRTGKAFETPKADFWRFRDGKAVEFFEYYDTAAIRDAAV
jgi:uncharacterized protein